MNLRWLRGGYPPAGRALSGSVVGALVLTLLAACGGDGDPTGPELPAAPHRVFVACADSTLRVLDVAQGAVVATLPLPARPISVAASPDGRRIYVGLTTPGGIVEVDAGSLDLLRTLPAPPMGLGLDVTPDGKSIVGTSQDDDVVVIVSLSTGTSKTVQVGENPQYLRVGPMGTTAWVPIFNTDELAAVNIGTGTVDARIPLGEITGGPAGVAVSPDGNTIYVGMFGTDPRYAIPWAWLLIVDREAGVFRRVEVRPYTVDVDITPDGRTLFLASDSITVVDAVTASVTAIIPFYAFGLAVPDDGEMLYVASYSTNTLEVVRIADRMPVQSFPVGPRPVAVEANFVP